MLQSPQGWQSPPELYAGVPGMHVLALNDGMPLLHTVALVHRDAFKRSLLQALQFRAERTALQASHPKVTDCFYRGHLCHSVIVATEVIDKTPIPPGRLRPSKRVVFLDKRPVLGGFVWLLLEGDTLDLTGLLRVLQTEAPPGHRADVRAAIAPIFKAVSVFLFAPA